MPPCFFQAASALHAGVFPALRVVGTPPAEAGRGFIPVSSTEIRHYGCDRKHPAYLVSRDSGEAWKYQKTGPDYPPNQGGMSKESPSVVRNPGSSEFIRVQPIKGRFPVPRIQRGWAYRWHP